MSIRRWLRTTDNPLPLPKAGGEGGVVAASKEVAAVAVAQSEKRKRGPYHRYGDKLRTKIAKYACKNGNKSAVVMYNVANNCVHVWIVAMLVRHKSMDVILSPGLKTLNILGANLFGFTVCFFQMLT